MKLKRPSAAGDYDTLADMDAESAAASPRPQLVLPKSPPNRKPHSLLSQPQSPDRTPQQSSTPPLHAANAVHAVHAVHAAAGKKRKSSAFLSLSDGEDHHHHHHHAQTPAKRPYQHHSLPVQRKSPRKSLKSLDGTDGSENIPPVPQRSQTPSQSSTSSFMQSQSQPQLQPAPPAPPAPSAHTSEPGRPLVSLSSNDLNGVTRAVSGSAPIPTSAAAATTTAFTVVNTAGFTPVNVTSSVQSTPNAPRNYSSPYSGASVSAPAPAPALSQSSTASPALAPAPPALAPVATMNSASAVPHGFQAINSPVINGHSARNSPVMPHTAHVTIAPHPPPQPQSRSHTPGPINTTHGSSMYNPSSRSNTPATSGPVPVGSHVIHPALHAVPQAVMHYAPPPPQPILKSHPLEVKPTNSIETNLLQCEVLGALMQYLFPKASAPPDEAFVLQRIEYLWLHNSASFRHQIGPMYELQERILTSWILERRKITQLRRSMAIAPGVSASEMVDRLLAMNDLRAMRLKWKNMSSQDGLSPEDLLCRAFAVMTNTEGTEYLFKDGLERLNEGVFEFLRNEDMRILMHKR